MKRLLVGPPDRLVIIGVGLAVAVLLWFVVSRTRLGMLIRAGASNRTMVAALGIDIRLLYTLVFGFGAALAGLAGLLAGPIFAVQPGMGEMILIQVFVVIVIGGIGSIRGAFAGALIVGMVDTMGRAFLKPALSALISPAAGDAAGPALASMLIYLLMAVVAGVPARGAVPRARELTASPARKHTTLSTTFQVKMFLNVQAVATALMNLDSARRSVKMRLYMKRERCLERS